MHFVTPGIPMSIHAPTFGFELTWTVMEPSQLGLLHLLNLDKMPLKKITGPVLLSVQILKSSMSHDDQIMNDIDQTIQVPSHVDLLRIQLV